MSKKTFVLAGSPIQLFVRVRCSYCPVVADISWADYEQDDALFGCPLRCEHRMLLGLDELGWRPWQCGWVCPKHKISVVPVEAR